jgi:hypothetical protein
MQRQLLIFYDILKEAIPPTKLVLSILQNNMHGKMQTCKDYKIVNTLLYFRQRYLHDKVERYKKYSDYMIYVTEAMPDGKCRTVRTQHKIWFDNEWVCTKIRVCIVSRNIDILLGCLLR